MPDRPSLELIAEDKTLFKAYMVAQKAFRDHLQSLIHEREARICPRLAQLNDPPAEA